MGEVVEDEVMVSPGASLSAAERAATKSSAATNGDYPFWVKELADEQANGLRLLAALKGAIGALEFSRDYHSDLGNEDQAFAQDRLDAALTAIAKAEAAQ